MAIDGSPQWRITIAILRFDCCATIEQHAGNPYVAPPCRHMQRSGPADTAARVNFRTGSHRRRTSLGLFRDRYEALRSGRNRRWRNF